jgi:threonylcarbamoyladenosine tRNA methylthiotransferase MtaB
VRALAAGGVKEIVLTGVQISAYRDGDARLAELVRALLRDALGPERRLRLTSIAPWDLDSRLLELWSDRRLCRHLHLSLQSGATETLRRMRRPYTAERFAERMEEVRAAISGVGVTTDVIVGFPGESAALFEESLATTAALGFAKVHVFPFSSRPGTAAAAMPQTVPADEKKERMARMLAVADDSERRFWASHLGSRQTVLWEKPRLGQAHGLTDNYIRVIAPDGGGVWNQFSEVHLTRLTEGGVVGEQVG